MGKGRGLFVVIGIGFVFAAGAGSTDAAEVRYAVTGLGQFTPTGMNDLGQAVGYTGTSGAPESRRAALWLPSPAYGLPAGLNDLGTMSVPNPGGGGDSRGLVAGDINNLGQIAGSAGLPGYAQRAVIWLPSPAFGRGAGWTTMDPTPGWDGDAGAINDAGQVTGHFHAAERAYLWLPAPAYGLPSGTNPLNMPTEGFGFGADVNSSGAVVGSNAVGSRSAPFHYLPAAAHGQLAGTQYLPTLPGARDPVATAINDRGQVIGSAVFSDPNDPRIARGYLWLPEPDAITGRPAGLHELRLPGAADTFTPTDINNAGLVIGIGGVAGSFRPFLWDPSTGNLTDLNSLIDPASGWELLRATAINEAGQILGTGRHNGVEQAFLLTVPEPTAAVLLLFGLALPLRRGPSRR